MAANLANQDRAGTASLKSNNRVRSESSAGEKPTRGSRSREKTRQKLVEAALRVMSEKGIDGTAINDITEAADVGVGSFYNHFKTKTEIATAVFEVHADELAAITRHIGERESDRAVAIAYIQRVFLTKAINDPVWGSFIVHVSNGLPEVSKVFAEQGTQHIREGREAGRFTIGCDRAAMRVILSSLLYTMRGLLEGELQSADASETVECLLRMLGVPGDEASSLSKRRLPAYVAKLFRKR